MYNSMYPVHIKPYVIGHNYKPVKPKEDNEGSNSADIQKDAKEQQYKNFEHQKYPNGDRTSIDYTKSNVNIAQIIEDFKKTTAAIAAPQDVENEVNTYLSLIEGQSNKATPNEDVIKSNLVSASKVLDEYIAKTLNRKSKVVENWIDALFLQKIEYKANPDADNPEFRVQLPEPEQKIEQAKAKLIGLQPEEQKQIEEATQKELPEMQATQEQAQKINPYSAMDKELKKMLVQAKKYTAINQDEKAFQSFKNALGYAKEVNDTQAQSIIHYEVGRLYDNYDVLPQALKNYNEAIEKTQDLNIKTHAHISMAKIYDDVVKFEPAMEHYFAAISYAGETDNLKAQTKALTNIGKMFSERYDLKNMDEYFKMATNIVQETGNEKAIAKTYTTYANSLEKVNEKSKALSYYSKGTKHYVNASNLENAGVNYEKASELMAEFGNKAKAKSLLLKAQNCYVEMNHTQKLNDINKKLKEFA